MTDYRCRRCDFRSSDADEIRQHAWIEPRHPRCPVCHLSLTEFETGACMRCIARTRADLADIEHGYAMLPSAVEDTRYRMGRDVGGTALVLLADGSVEGGGPDDWPTDPTPVLAVVESHERDWRHAFGHGPAENMATVTGCVGYLTRHLAYAAEHHEAFDDFARDIHRLRNQLWRVNGLQNIPMKAQAPCRECGGTLVRRYLDDTGLEDDWWCETCGSVVEQSEYFFGLRVSAAEAGGWVPVGVAAEHVGRSQTVIRQWIAEGRVSVRRHHRRDEVLLDECRAMVETKEKTA